MFHCILSSVLLNSVSGVFYLRKILPNLVHSFVHQSIYLSALYIIITMYLPILLYRFLQNNEYVSTCIFMSQDLAETLRKQLYQAPVSKHFLA